MTLAETSVPLSTPVVVVRPMRLRDCDFAAALHARALSHGFFGRLGLPFLTAYYESFTTSPHAVAYLARTADGPAGFLVGTFGPHNSWVLRNRGMRLARRGALALLARPAELAHFLRTRTMAYARRLLGSGARSVPPQRARRNAPPAVLTHVAVTRQARGLGVGSVLVDAFVDAAEEAGASQACLVTLAGPRGAGAFYRRLGWQLREVRHDRDGRPIESFCIEL